MAGELIMFAGAAVVLSAGCLVPNRWLPRLPNDKLMHFAGFALLSVLAVRAAGSADERWLWLSGLLVFGLVIECLQGFVPGRSFCWRDLAANAAGIALVAVWVEFAPRFA